MIPQRVLICVPARLASTRLPNKLLAGLGHQTVMEHVCERILGVASKLGQLPVFRCCEIETWVVTDTPALGELARAKGVHVFLSQHPHESGTERIREFVQARARSETQGWLEGTLVVNVQGDEPFVDEGDVRDLVAGFVAHLGDEPAGGSPAVAGTLVHRNPSLEDFLDPSCVKVVRRQDGQALYFSRAPIPWPRQILGTYSLMQQSWGAGHPLPPTWGFWQHIGIYVYVGAFLFRYTRQQAESDALDLVEGLEQLGVLFQGQQIWTTEARQPSFGIDTPADLERARVHLQRLSGQLPTED